MSDRAKKQKQREWLVTLDFLRFSSPNAQQDVSAFGRAVLEAKRRDFTFRSDALFLNETINKTTQFVAHFRPKSTNKYEPKFLTLVVVPTVQHHKPQKLRVNIADFAFDLNKPHTLRPGFILATLQVFLELSITIALKNAPSPTVETPRRKPRLTITVNPPTPTSHVSGTTYAFSCHDSQHTSSQTSRSTRPPSRGFTEAPRTSRSFTRQAPMSPRPEPTLCPCQTQFFTDIADIGPLIHLEEGIRTDPDAHVVTILATLVDLFVKRAAEAPSRDYLLERLFAQFTAFQTNELFSDKQFLYLAASYAGLVGLWTARSQERRNPTLESLISQVQGCYTRAFNRYVELAYSQLMPAVRGCCENGFRTARPVVAIVERTARDCTLFRTPEAGRVAEVLVRLLNLAFLEVVTAPENSFATVQCGVDAGPFFGTVEERLRAAFADAPRNSFVLVAEIGRVLILNKALLSNEDDRRAICPHLTQTQMSALLQAIQTSQPDSGLTAATINKIGMQMANQAFDYYDFTLPRVTSFAWGAQRYVRIDVAGTVFEHHLYTRPHGCAGVPPDARA